MARGTDVPPPKPTNPPTTLGPVLDAWRRQAEKQQKVLGLDIATLTTDLRSEYKIMDSIKGVLITGVDATSVAAGKLAAGDVIVAAQFEEVSNAIDFKRLVDQLKKDGQAWVGGKSGLWCGTPKSEPSRHTTSAWTCVSRTRCGSCAAYVSPLVRGNAGPSFPERAAFPRRPAVRAREVRASARRAGFAKSCGGGFG
jgi:hypothetical protein